MKYTPVGIDIAKNVFQVHYVDEHTGEIVNKAIKRSSFLKYFSNKQPCLIGMESMFRRAALGSRICEDGTSGKAHVSKVCKSF